MSFLSKLWSKKNYRIASTLGGLMVLWLASGLLVGDESPTGAKQDLTKASAQSKTTVKARNITAADYPMSVSLRARTEPNRQVDLRAELSGRVVSLPVEKGGFVKQGDVICELAAEDRQEKLQQAKAGLEKATLDYDGALRLKTGGYQSRTAIADALSRLESARAMNKRAELDADNLKIKAPFDGVVDARPVELGDFVQRGDVCASVLDMDPLLVTGRLAETEVGFVGAGALVETVLVTGESVQGKVRFVERASDAITRTFRVEALVDNADLQLRSGITAQLNVPVGVVRAHEVNSSLLALDDSGELGLRIIDGDKRVRFVRVELIGDGENGVWVKGLPDNTTLITIGSQYVTSGEQVAVIMEQSETTLSATDI